jgi:hypothetical protein
MNLYRFLFAVAALCLLVSLALPVSAQDLGMKSPQQLSDSGLVRAMDEEIKRIETMLAQLPLAVQKKVGAAETKQQLDNLKPDIARLGEALLAKNQEEEEHDRARAGAETDLVLLRAIRMKLDPTSSFVPQNSGNPASSLAEQARKAPQAALAKMKEWVPALAGVKNLETWVGASGAALVLVPGALLIRNKIGSGKRRSGKTNSRNKDAPLPAKRVRMPKRGSPALPAMLPIVNFNLVPGLSNQTIGGASEVGSCSLCMDFNIALSMMRDAGNQAIQTTLPGAPGEDTVETALGMGFEISLRLHLDNGDSDLDSHPDLVESSEVWAAA